MQNKKGLIIILIPVIIILIFVAIKSLNKNNFNLDSQQVLESSLNQEHILSLNQLQMKLQGSSDIAVLIDIRSNKDFKQVHLKNALNIPFSEILKNKEFEKLKSNGMEIVLYSNSTIESAKACIFLTQMGYRKLYLLDIPGDLISDDILHKDTIIESSETLKYKFQPDTLSGME